MTSPASVVFAVLVDAWKSLILDLLLADIGTPRQRALLKAMVFARLLFPCSKLVWPSTIIKWDFAKIICGIWRCFFAL